MNLSAAAPVQAKSLLDWLDSRFATITVALLAVGYAAYELWLNHQLSLAVSSAQAADLQDLADKARIASAFGLSWLLARDLLLNHKSYVELAKGVAWFLALMFTMWLAIDQFVRFAEEQLSTETVHSLAALAVDRDQASKAGQGVDPVSGSLYAFLAGDADAIQRADAGLAAKTTVPITAAQQELAEGRAKLEAARQQVEAPFEKAYSEFVAGSNRALGYGARGVRSFRNQACGAEPNALIDRVAFARLLQRSDCLDEEQTGKYRALGTGWLRLQRGQQDLAAGQAQFDAKVASMPDEEQLATATLIPTVAVILSMFSAVANVIAALLSMVPKAFQRYLALPVVVAIYTFLPAHVPAQLAGAVGRMEPVEAYLATRAIAAQELADSLGSRIWGGL